MMTSTPQNAKRRVDVATQELTKTRCLITNVECDTATDYAHVLARAVEGQAVMNNLEFSWRKIRKTQNIDTRYNIFRLSGKFHRLFDTNKWLLLPELRIIDKYLRALPYVANFPDIEESRYNYTLVAHPGMKHVPIHRRNEELVTSSPTYKKFVYPFEQFPIIVSHVHPRFVICDAGRKLQDPFKIMAFAKGDEGELYKKLADVSKIYEMWANVTPEPYFYQPRNEPKAQLGNSRPGRESRADISYVESPPHPPNPPPSSTVQERGQPSGSVADRTPDERECTSYAIDDDAKLRVDNVAPKRCTIEHTDKSNALDYAHVLSRRTKDQTLTSLEYSWGMNYKSLNVDTRRNIFRLSKTFHRLFDGRAWLLLPEKRIIDQYFRVRHNPAEFPLIDDEKYYYTLHANNLMQDFPIHVQRDEPPTLFADGEEEHDGGDANEDEGEEGLENEEFSDDEDEDSDGNIDFDKEDAFITHTYPFHQFPIIESHIHPRFVIYDAGKKLISGSAALSFFEVHPDLKVTLKKVVRLFRSWTAVRSRDDFLKAGRLRDKPEDNWPDDQTEPRRLPNLTGKRAFSPLEGDGSPKLTKRPKSGGDQDCAWLDDATLGELDPDRSQQKAWQDKIAWIKTWVGQVPLDATDPMQLPVDIGVTDKIVCHTPDQYDLDSEDLDSVLSA